MNALEREIIEKVNSYGRDRFVESMGFKAGANFILEKNIDEQLVEWIGKSGYKYEYDHWVRVVGTFGDAELEQKTTTELKHYWLNNVYGK